MSNFDAPPSVHRRTGIEAGLRPVENYGAPTALINQLWEVLQSEPLPPDDPGQATEYSTANYEAMAPVLLRHVLHHVKGLPLDMPIQKGTWDSYRIIVPNPAGGEMKVDIFLKTDEHMDRSGLFNMHFEPYESNYPEAAKQYWLKTTVHLKADPTFVERRLAQKQQQVEDQELASAQRYEAKQAAATKLIQHYNPIDAALALVPVDPMVREFLVTHLELPSPEAADDYTINLKRELDTPDDYTITIYRQENGQRTVWDVAQYTV